MVKLRKLTTEEIETLMARQGVRQIALVNFLFFMDGYSRSDALDNLSTDAILYKWNAATLKAIRDGINLASKGAK